MRRKLRQQPSDSTDAGVALASSATDRRGTQPVPAAHEERRSPPERLSRAKAQQHSPTRTLSHHRQPEPQPRSPRSRALGGGPMESAAVDQLFARIQRHMHSEYSRQVDVFREIDTDDSGTLTAVELQRALSQMEGGGAPSRADVDALLRAVDEDGSGTVTLDEFFDFFKHARRAATRSPRSYRQALPPTWHVPEKLQVQSTSASPGTRAKGEAAYKSSQPQSVLWMNGLIEEYSRASCSAQAPTCSFLEWATATSQSKQVVTTRFLRACRADQRVPEQSYAPAEWKPAAEPPLASDHQILRTFMQAVVADVFKVEPRRLGHSELSQFLHSALAAETDVPGHVEQRADWLLEVAGSSYGETVYTLARDTFAQDKPWLTGEEDDILPKTVGHFPAGSYVVLLDTQKDQRGRSWAKVEETFDIQQYVLGGGDDRQLEAAATTHRLRGWVQLVSFTSVLRPARLPKQMTVRYIGVEQLSSLLGAELHLATLMAWASQSAQPVAATYEESDDSLSPIAEPELELEPEPERAQSPRAIVVNSLDDDESDDEELELEPQQPARGRQQRGLGYQVRSPHHAEM